MEYSQPKGIKKLKKVFWISSFKAEQGHNSAVDPDPSVLSNSKLLTVRMEALDLLAVDHHDPLVASSYQVEVHQDDRLEAELEVHLGRLGAVLPFLYPLVASSCLVVEHLPEDEQAGRLGDQQSVDRRVLLSDQLNQLVQPFWELLVLLVLQCQLHDRLHVQRQVQAEN
eukprot:scpid63981/ scgid30654/ 